MRRRIYNALLGSIGCAMIILSTRQRFQATGRGGTDDFVNGSWLGLLVSGEARQTQGDPPRQ
jgi:hypothetical protein